MKAERDRLQQKVALLGEEIRIKGARMAAINPHCRPYYPPLERLAILELKAARNGYWSRQPARVTSRRPLVLRGLGGWTRKALMPSCKRALP
jgi:hypothetical protein